MPDAQIRLTSNFSCFTYTENNLSKYNTNLPSFKAINVALKKREHFKVIFELILLTNKRTGGGEGGVPPPFGFFKL